MLVHLHTHACTRTVTGLITFFVPCYTAGKNAEMVGESCIIHCLLSFVPILNVWCHANVRGKVRDQKKIDVSAWAVVILTEVTSHRDFTKEFAETFGEIKLVTSVGATSDAT